MFLSTSVTLAVSCPGTQVLCNNVCQDPPAPNPNCAPAHRNDNCGNCTSCLAGYLDNGVECAKYARLQATEGTPENGFINIDGVVTSGTFFTNGNIFTMSNIFLANGKAIRVDTDSGEANLWMGNWGDGTFKLNIDGNFKLSGSAAFGDYVLDQTIFLTTPSLFSAKAQIGIGSTAPGDNGLSVSGDIYLANGKAIRVDGSGTTSLYIGNWMVGGDIVVSIYGRFWVNGNTWIDGDLYNAGNAIVRGNVALGGYDPDSTITLTTPSFFAAKAQIGFESTDPGANGLSVSGNITAGGAIKGNFVDTDGTSCGNNQILKKVIDEINERWECTDVSGAAVNETDPVFTAWQVAGCFGPVFKHISSSISSGAVGGYVGANTTKCAQGEHVCTTTEVLNSINCLADIDTVALASATNGVWVSAGAAALPTPTNDCNGWTSGESSWQGVHYVYSTTGGNFNAKSCDTVLPFACCK